MGGMDDFLSFGHLLLNDGGLSMARNKMGCIQNGPLLKYTLRKCDDKNKMNFNIIRHHEIES